MAKSELSPEEIKRRFAFAADLFKNEDRVDPGKLRALQSLWRFDKKVVEKIYRYFNSFDEADVYLDRMDAHTDPDLTDEERMVEAWEGYCESNDIDHEIGNNPFLD